MYNREVVSIFSLPLSLSFRDFSIEFKNYVYCIYIYMYICFFFSRSIRSNFRDENIRKYGIVASDNELKWINDDFDSAIHAHAHARGPL